MTPVRVLRSQVPWSPRFAEDSRLFAALREPSAMFSLFTDFPTPEAIDAALSARAGVRFVRSEPPRARPGQPPRPRREQDLYDASIATGGAVPTRPSSWHDFLNALVWAIFPNAKRTLHQRQHALVARGLDPITGRLPGARTREQDALALFDEGGLVVAAHDDPNAVSSDIARALEVGTATGVVFGHAIYETFVLGVPWPTVRAIVVDERAGSIDEALARVLRDPAALTSPDALPRVKLTPLL